MQIRFTYILIFMMAAGALLASCSGAKDDGVKPGSEVQFAASDVSRSSVSTSLNYAGSRFVVFGDMKLADSSSPKNVVIFNGVPMSYDDSKWTYANTQYWFPKHEHSFVAIYPAEVVEAVGVANTTYSDNSLSFGYTQPENFRDTPDLLAATHRRMYEEGATPTVMLNFVHALSRVNFVVKCDGAGEKVLVKEIRLKDMRKSGTLTVSPASLTEGSRQTDDYDLYWTGSQNSGTLVADVEVEVADGSESPIFPAGDALFVIPQPDNKDIIMSITYTLFYKNGNTEERTLEAETHIGGWRPGKVYTYSLTFEADIKEIEMNVSVNDWKVGPAIDDVRVPRK